MDITHRHRSILQMPSNSVVLKPFCTKVLENDMYLATEPPFQILRVHILYIDNNNPKRVIPVLKAKNTKRGSCPAKVCFEIIIQICKVTVVVESKVHYLPQRCSAVEV